MFEYLEKFWKQMWCDHHWELAYTADDATGKRLYHYICLNCGVTRVTTEKIKNS